jgi:hypothetical protein
MLNLINNSLESDTIMLKIKYRKEIIYNTIINTYSKMYL